MNASENFPMLTEKRKNSKHIAQPRVQKLNLSG